MRRSWDSNPSVAWKPPASGVFLSPSAVIDIGGEFTKVGPGSGEQGGNGFLVRRDTGLAPVSG